jgi:hypothetical protein
MARWLKAAVLLGLTPLATGVSVYLMWLFVRWDWLVFAGVFTVCGGLLCVAAGLASLVVYWRLARRQGDVTNLRRRVAAVGFLLFVNFPAVFAVGVGAVHVKTRYTVAVRNESPSAVDRLELSGGGVHLILETVPAGRSREVSFRFTQDGCLRYGLRHDGREHRGVVEGYVTGGLGGHSVLVIDGDGQVSVRQVPLGVRLPQTCP